MEQPPQQTGDTGEMKTFLLIDIDSTVPNLALHKRAKWHKNNGDEVIWNLPMMRHVADKIYASCLFTKNKDEAAEWADYGADVGGTGYDTHKKLPEEIENTACRINWGFTTRGCIRECSFCIVREKEGLIHPVGDLYSIWDGKAQDVVMMDNNILALPDHFKKVCNQIRAEKVRVDFNQGLDHRLLTPELCAELKAIRHKTYRFAFDHPSLEPSVRKAVSMLQKSGIKQAVWYVLTNFDTTLDEDMARLETLKSLGQRAFLMRYNHKRDDMVYNDMAAWTSMGYFFATMTFDQFRELRHNKKQAVIEL